MERAIKILEAAYNQASYNIEIEEAYLLGREERLARGLVVSIDAYIQEQRNLMKEIRDVLHLIEYADA